MNVASKNLDQALADCVAAYGPRGSDSAERITSVNRGPVKIWLVSNGIPSRTVSGFPLATLRELWRDTSDNSLALWATNTPAIKPANDLSEPSDASDDITQALKKFIGANKAGLDEKRVIELIEKYAVKTVRTELALPDGRVHTLAQEPHHAVFPELLAAVGAGLNVLLVGPAGSGKTHVCGQVAKALGLSYGFTGAVAQEHKLLGFRNAVGDLVSTVYRDKYENGGLFLFDEIDASSAQALLAFNAGLANGEQDFPDACVKMHADYRCIASANTFGMGANAQYVGRNKLDAATLDRFFVIPMGYDAAMEAAVYGRGEIAPVSLYKPQQCDASEWTAYVHKVRAAVERLGMLHVVSGRAIASGIKALSAGIPRAAVERGVLWKSLQAGDVAKIKAAV